jgi:hypothetical protein
MIRLVLSLSKGPDRVAVICEQCRQWSDGLRCRITGGVSLHFLLDLESLRCWFKCVFTFELGNPAML